jgi:hypothetical protein
MLLEKRIGLLMMPEDLAERRRFTDLDFGVNNVRPDN